MSNSILLWESDDGKIKLHTALDGTYITIGFTNGNSSAIHSMSISDFVDMVNACRGRILSKVTNDAIVCISQLDEIIAKLRDEIAMVKYIGENGIVEDGEYSTSEIDEVVRMLSLVFMSQR